MKKKLAAGLTASAIVSTTLAVTPAEAATIKVKSGDSLWKLAQNYNTSVAAITSANHLRLPFCLSARRLRFRAAIPALHLLQAQQPRRAEVLFTQ